MALYQFGDERPLVAPTAWVADSATVIGRVELAEGSSIWYGAVLRGDNELMRIGRNTNIQDASVLHTDIGFPLTLGDDVLVGHQCMLHGCTIGDGTLIGMQAVVLNGARIGRQCIVGAGSIVTERKEFPDGMLIVGSPAKVMRPLTPEEIERVARGTAAYVLNADRHRRMARRID